MLRRVHHFSLRADLHDLTRVHDSDAICHIRREHHVVRDDDDGRPHLPMKRQKLLHHRFLHRRIQCARRLVRQEQLRLQGQRHSDGHALLHPAAEFEGVAVQHALCLVHIELLQDCRCLLTRLAPREIRMIADRFYEL